MAIQALTRDELHDLLLEAWKASDRDHLMILVGYLHALRASEITALRYCDIQGGHLTVQRRKGSLKTTQALVKAEDPLFDEASLLIDYAEQSNSRERIFPITRQHFWRLFRRYCERANIPPHKAHPHVLKHTLCTEALKTAGINAVKQYAGHKNMGSTGRYTEVTDEQATIDVHKSLRFDSIENFKGVSKPRKSRRQKHV